MQQGMQGAEPSGVAPYHLYLPVLDVWFDGWDIRGRCHPQGEQTRTLKNCSTLGPNYLNGAANYVLKESPIGLCNRMETAENLSELRKLTADSMKNNSGGLIDRK